MVEGRRRWIAQQKALKAAGVIQKLPCGRKLRSPKRSRDRRIAAAQRVIEQMEHLTMKTKSGLPARLPDGTPVPFEAQSHAEQLGTLTGCSLRLAKAVLDAPVNFDVDNVKLLAIQKDFALSILSLQHRVASAQLQPPPPNNPILAELMRKLKEDDAPKPVSTIDLKPKRPRKRS
jgi:hypothetical protein